MKSPAFCHYLIGQNGPDEVFFPLIDRETAVFIEEVGLEEESRVSIENLEEIDGLIRAWEVQRETERKLKRKRQVLTIKSSSSGVLSGRNPRKSFKKSFILIE